MDVTEQARWAVVEDSDDDFAALARAFRVEPVSLTRWLTGEAALLDLQADRAPRDFDVILVDLNLPGMDGCEFIERVRGLADGQLPVVCVLTSSRLPSDEHRAEAAGADGYLVKPDDLQGLRALPGHIADIVARRAA